MKKWAAFWLVGLIWGSSFLLIRIGVEEMSPFQVVFIRTAIAAIGFNILLFLQGKRLPFSLSKAWPLILLGLFNTTVPFVLITWGEITVESGLASVLQATAALFGLVIAHFTLADEKINAQRLVGLIVGFLGVIILSSKSWGEDGISGSLAGQLAIVVASFFYAIMTVYSKKTLQKGYDPMIVAGGAQTFAAISSGIGMIVAPLLGGQPATPLAELDQSILLAVFGLGFVNTFIAYILFYWMIGQLGAARSTMVTYIVPAVGLILGTIILDEPLYWQLLVGAGLIFLGIAVVNLKIFNRSSVKAT